MIDLIDLMPKPPEHVWSNWPWWKQPEWAIVWATLFCGVAAVWAVHWTLRKDRISKLDILKRTKTGIIECVDNIINEVDLAIAILETKLKATDTVRDLNMKSLRIMDLKISFDDLKILKMAELNIISPMSGIKTGVNSVHTLIFNSIQELSKSNPQKIYQIPLMI